jgi:HlyD family secretion protein
MSSTTTITTDTKNNVLAVPLEAIVEKAPAAASPGPTISGSVPAATPGGEKAKPQKGVYIVEANTNKVKFVEVTTGITGETDIEVTSGLKQDMEVVRGPSRVLKTLKDGMTIKRQTKKPGNVNGNEAS